MTRTGWVYDERFLRHDTGYGHPERPDRLRAIVEETQRRGLLERLTTLPFRPASLAWIEANHAPDYIERLRRACAQGLAHIDCADSAICPESFDIALLAVGGVLAACDAVMDGRVGNAFCAVRPPGHHCERDRSLGFCLFNNIAIAARYLRGRHGLSRVLILDWDVHHGNGTQHSFEDDPTVFFCSLHEHPDYCYPGTGYAEERGVGTGVGATLNLPMMPGAVDEDYRRVFEERFVPAARAFKPEFLLVSAGYDAHTRDPLAQVDLTDAGFTSMADRTIALARELCGGRLVCILEGGYDLPALSANVANLLEQLLAAGD